ncbi:MAG: archaeosortase/exosortase family protein [Halobacteriota archaeon]
MDRSVLRKDHSVALKLGLLCACLIFTFAVFRSVFAGAALLFDYATLKQNGFYFWAVLALCILWTYIKRADIVEASRGGTDAKWLIFGLLLVSVSIVLLFYVSAFSASLPLILFAIGFVIVAQFSLFFGQASKIPLLLLGLFGVAVGFPVLLENTTVFWFPRVTAVLCVSTLQSLGLPVTLNGVTVTLTSLLGYDIVTKVDSRCAGSDSLAIFLAIFGLMIIDRKPQNKLLIGLLIFGVIGTYLQNFVRLLLLFAAGYYYGADALWTVHDYASYVLFPVWFLGFSVIYLRYVRKPENSAIERKTSAKSSSKL